MTQIHKTGLCLQPDITFPLFVLKKAFFPDSDFSFWDFRSSNVLASLLLFMLSVLFILLLLSFKLLLICSSSFIFFSNSVSSDFVVKPSSSSPGLSLFFLILFALLFLRSVSKLSIFALGVCIY